VQNSAYLKTDFVAFRAISSLPNMELCRLHHWMQQFSYPQFLLVNHTPHVNEARSNQDA
jgi:hypothetical protein